MPNINMDRALRALPIDLIDCFRDVDGGRIKGVRVRGGFTSTGTNIRAHVQPTTPQQMRFIVGGEEVSQAITIWTKQDLRTTEDNEGREADRIHYRGKEFKIIGAFDWSGTGHRQYIAGPVRELAVS